MTVAHPSAQADSVFDPNNVAPIFEAPGIDDTGTSRSSAALLMFARVLVVNFWSFIFLPLFKMKGGDHRPYDFKFGPSSAGRVDGLLVSALIPQIPLDVLEGRAIHAPPRRVLAAITGKLPNRIGPRTLLTKP